MPEQSKVKKQTKKKQKMWGFLQSMSEQTTLKKITTEVLPKKAGGNRQDSDIVWDGLEFYFGLKGEGTVKELSAKQGCGTDLQCLRMKVMQHLNVFDEEMLAQLQAIVAHMHNPPYNSLKDWFTLITAAVRKSKLSVVKKELFKRYMRSPEANMLIQTAQAKENVIKKNRNQLNVNYSHSLQIVQTWGASDDWEDQLLAVMAAIGCRKTALLDSVITFQEAIQHDKDFWIKQVGVLKDRSQVTVETAEGDLEFIAGKEVEKPIAFGFTYTEVKTMISNIRASVDTTGMSRKQMGALHADSLVKRVKKAFPGPANQDKRLGTHFLR